MLEFMNKAGCYVITSTTCVMAAVRQKSDNKNRNPDYNTVIFSACQYTSDWDFREVITLYDWQYL
jgi:hypothetical protein